MPWRKQTLTPFRSDKSSGEVSNSDRASNADEFSVEESHGNLFGGSDCEINWSQVELNPGVGTASGSNAWEVLGDNIAEPVLSKPQFDRFWGHAFLSVAQTSDLKMPWEKGVFAKIFGEEETMPQFTVPCPRLTTGIEDSADVVQDLADAASKVHSISDAVFPHAISCLTDKDFQCRQTELMHKACDKWLAILAVDLSSSEVGRNLEGLGELDNHRDEAREIIAAVIGVRSYNTAITRANSVLKFLKAVLNETPQIKEPFQEELVWRYFHELKRSGGATSAASTLSAFRYAKFIMGFSCLDGVVNSRRLKGYSEVLYANKRKLQQALTLNVQQIRSLHTKLEDCNAESFDRASAGFMLTAIYGRCRASDLSFLDNIKHDHDSHEGFVELFTAVHKTGRSAVKKSILLPILVPAIGITGNNWATTMREVCEQSGLAFDGQILGPLLRPPSQQGPFLCKRGVTTTEIGKLLRGLVGETIDVANPHEPHLSAHSLKATGLAWAARYGMSWPDRAILGRHQSHTNETIAIYSRDLAVGPVTRFAEVVAAIRKGSFFCPDAERSKYFPFPPLPPDTTKGQSQEQGADVGAEGGPQDTAECKSEVTVPDVAEMVILDSESGSSESAGSESGAESTSSEDLEPPNKKGVAARRTKLSTEGSWVSHKKIWVAAFLLVGPIRRQ